VSRRWSLRRRLVASVLALVAVALGTLACLLYLTLRETLRERFDEDLAEGARAIAAHVEEGPGGRWEVEDDADGHELPEGLWYRLRSSDGVDLGGSQRLPGPAALAGLAPGVPTTVTLEGGMRGRALVLSLAPRLDEAVDHPSGRRLEVVVVRPTRELDDTLATLRAELAGATGLVSVLAALLGGWVVACSVRHVEALGRQLDAIDAPGLDRRLSADSLPDELLSTATKVNELLGRLEASFGRERRFSEDVAHELRTPLSGLLAITELQLGRERTAAEHRQALHELHGIARDMLAMVESLLALARAEAGALAGATRQVDLKELVDGSYSLLEPAAARRGLRFTNQIVPGTRVRSDAQALRLVTQNLLANAVAYTEPGGWVNARSDPEQGLWLLVADSGPQLPPGDVERVFQRFVRLDPARPAGSHHGIGLALVRALCTRLGLSVAAENEQDGSLAFSVRTPAGARAAS
jgi:two-component system sensor histidine kinase QseC